MNWLEVLNESISYAEMGVIHLVRIQSFPKN